MEMKKSKHKIIHYFANGDHVIDLFVVLIILLLPLYGLHISFFGMPLGLIEILTLTVFAISFFSGSVQLAEIKKQRLLVIGALLMCSGVFIATIFSSDHLREGFGVLKSWFLIPILFALVVWMRGLKNRRTIKIYGGAYFVSALIVSVTALIYYFSGDVTYDGRLSGHYTSPNYLALYISPAIFYLLYLKSFSFWWKFTSLFGGMIIAIALYLTNSFGAWIAILGSTMIIVLLIKPKRIWYVLCIVGIGAILVVVTQYNGQKMTDLRTIPERSSIASRIMIWESALMIGREHAVIGIAPNTFQDHYLRYQEFFPPYLEWAVPQPHNLYLAFWLQSGLIGLTGFLGVLFWFYQRMYLFIRKNASVAFLVASMTSIVLHGFIDTPYWKNDLAFVFWLLIGMSAALNSHLHRVEFQQSQVDTTDRHSD